MKLPAAWAGAGQPSWVPMAPGVSFFLSSPSPNVVSAVSVETAAILSRCADEIDLAGPSAGRPLSRLQRMSGYAAAIAGCLFAKACLIDWRGVFDLRTGKPADLTDPAAIRSALIEGTGPASDPVLTPLLAWLQPVDQAARPDFRALKTAHANEPVLITDTAKVAWTIANEQSDLWVTDAAGPEGFNYLNALLEFESRSDDADCDIGTAFRCFQMIEQSWLESRNG